ncbi:monoamine oxidase [Rhodococcus sp. LBL1]|nr:monoamine oxidase [Rhodococcus sp. LBL1]MDH6682147.1 monoamine oxidase [Rhodococcus sp. LBL2]
MNPVNGPDIQLTRRRLLGYGGAVGLSALLFAGTPQAQAQTGSRGSLGSHGSNRADVIVLGAGVSGLGAARTVADAGRSVIVLEARDRIGGRLWTDRTTMGMPVERGAELIHGADVSTWDIVGPANISTHRWGTKMSRFDPSTPWVDQDTWQFYNFPQGKPNVPTPLPAPNPDETAERYLGRLGIPRANYPLAFLVIEVDSEQFDKLPAEDVVETLETALTAPASGPIPSDGYGDFRVIGGYDQVVRILADGIDVRKNHKVTRVAHSRNGVEVLANGTRFTARKLVIALPAGVLQQESIAFDPPLPSTQRSRISEVVYLPVYKGLLEFSAPVLPDGWDLAEDYRVNPPTLWNGSASAPGYSGQVVVAWATGDEARELLAAPEAERFAQSLDAVRSMAGDAGLTTIATSTYDWSRDEFARGAYPGPTSRREGLYDPIHRTVFWAGMVTSTVSSSLDSGRAAGAAALGAL